jgi:hypothetical protein
MFAFGKPCLIFQPILTLNIYTEKKPLIEKYIKKSNRRRKNKNASEFKYLRFYIYMFEAFSMIIFEMGIITFLAITIQV